MDACKRILETHVIQVIISDVVKCVPYLVDLLLSSSLVHAGPKDPEPEDDEESGGLLEQLLVNCIVVCQTLEHVSCNVCVSLCLCVSSMAKSFLVYMLVPISVHLGRPPWLQRLQKAQEAVGA